jgi:hypothetical protein
MRTRRGSIVLRDTQISFATSVLAGDTAAAARIRGGKLPAARRIEIYRHNVFTNLRGALKDIYPVVLAVVGESFFVHAADRYVEAHPSRCGDLNRFGGEWAAFLGTYPHALALPYLPDVARLEWAWHEAFHAADARAFDLAGLATLPAEEHAALRFILHPAARLLQSPFPILRVWELNQPAFDGEMAVDWDASADSLLVRRDTTDGVTVLIERIPAATFAFLEALEKNATLDAATSAAHGIDGAFDLQSLLLEAVGKGIIVDFVKQ